MPVVPKPIVLASNRPAPRFYRGGRRITDFRGDAPAGEFEPEDWVGSTTTVAGHATLGLTVLPDGTTLAAAIAADPEGWLGAVHVARYGADTRLLVKLLDPGQRLPVHAHPSALWASEHVARAHGKVEAWFILSPGDVHLGLRDDVGADALAALVAAQDTEALLGLLNTVTVSPGDVVFVPAGVLHAIGEGVLLVELQEPEDLSILLEWRGFELDGERDGNLGVGFDLALSAVDHGALSAQRLGELVRPAGFGSVFPAEADEFFRLERVKVDERARLEAGFAILIVTDGEMRLGELALQRGSTVVVPHASGPITLDGRGEVLACRPPRSGD